ncbi:hypothetical protein AMAG_17865 [Allomyces macrogynus ATCC 38327]|uniref:Cyclic nucleotide-binding domain-containing protein n=1 Tax=Allomyces macrogynus (strain ATCC 38327) TaxID=578462 RepID=A0A0L0S146_ALLM3|nr:hypothetical protein AMAG_17865 [Allomyces macrogynus ATCC 38327]|eukprot:KNE56079.1 hypothetical protein AMAG_17865 [Allomyces macrogynus ATCC 38327]
MRRGGVLLSTENVATEPAQPAPPPRPYGSTRALHELPDAAFAIPRSRAISTPGLLAGPRTSGAHTNPESVPLPASAASSLALSNPGSARQSRSRDIAVASLQSLRSSRGATTGVSATGLTTPGRAATASGSRLADPHGAVSANGADAAMTIPPPRHVTPTRLRSADTDSNFVSLENLGPWQPPRSAIAGAPPAKLEPPAVPFYFPSTSSMGSSDKDGSSLGLIERRPALPPPAPQVAAMRNDAVAPTPRYPLPPGVTVNAAVQGQIPIQTIVTSPTETDLVARGQNTSSSSLTATRGSEAALTTGAGLWTVAEANTNSHAGRIPVFAFPDTVPEQAPQAPGRGTLERQQAMSTNSLQRRGAGASAPSGGLPMGSAPRAGSGGLLGSPTRDSLSRPTYTSPLQYSISGATTDSATSSVSSTSNKPAGSSVIMTSVGPADADSTHPRRASALPAPSGQPPDPVVTSRRDSAPGIRLTSSLARRAAAAAAMGGAAPGAGATHAPMVPSPLGQRIANGRGSPPGVSTVKLAPTDALDTDGSSDRHDRVVGISRASSYVSDWQSLPGDRTPLSHQSEASFNSPDGSAGGSGSGPDGTALTVAGSVGSRLLDPIDSFYRPPSTASGFGAPHPAPLVPRHQQYLSVNSFASVGGHAGASASSFTSNASVTHSMASSRESGSLTRASNTASESTPVVPAVPANARAPRTVTSPPVATPGTNGRAGPPPPIRTAMLADAHAGPGDGSPTGSSTTSAAVRALRPRTVSMPATGFTSQPLLGVRVGGKRVCTSMESTTKKPPPPAGVALASPNTPSTAVVPNLGANSSYKFGGGDEKPGATGPAPGTALFIPGGASSPGSDGATAASAPAPGDPSGAPTTAIGRAMYWLQGFHKRQIEEVDTPFWRSWRRLIMWIELYNMLCGPFAMSWICHFTITPVYMYVGYILDLLLLLDVWLNLNHRYENEYGVVVANPKEIKDHYLKHKFGYWDLAGSVPLDLLCLVMPLVRNEPLRCPRHYFPDTNTYGFFYTRSHVPDYLYAWAILRMTRWFRLPRLVQEFRNWSIHGVHIAYARLIKNFVVLAIYVHIDACFFFMLNTWEDVGTAWIDSEKLRDPNAEVVFVTQFYSTFHTSLKTFVYVFRKLQTNSERLYCTFEIMIGTVIYGSIFGVLSNFIRALDTKAALEDEAEKHKLKMDYLKKFLRTRRFPVDLQRKILHHEEFLWVKGQGMDEGTLFGNLPKSLRQDVYNHMYMDLVNQVPLFKGTDWSFKANLTRAMRTVIAPADFYICRQGDDGSEMYFIRSGEIEVVTGDLSRVLVTLTQGSFFGEIALFEESRRTATVRTKTVSELCVLTKEAFQDILRLYPAMAEIFRQAIAERKALDAKRKAEAEAAAKVKADAELAEKLKAERNQARKSRKMMSGSGSGMKSSASNRQHRTITRRAGGTGGTGGSGSDERGAPRSSFGLLGSRSKEFRVAGGTAGEGSGGGGLVPTTGNLLTSALGLASMNRSLMGSTGSRAPSEHDSASQYSGTVERDHDHGGGGGHAPTGHGTGARRFSLNLKSIMPVSMNRPGGLGAAIGASISNLRESVTQLAGSLGNGLHEPASAHGTQSRQSRTSGLDSASARGGTGARNSYGGGGGRNGNGSDEEAAGVSSSGAFASSPRSTVSPAETDERRTMDQDR